VDLAWVGHAESFHDGARPAVVSLGEGDDGAEVRGLVDELQACSADLGGVAVSPVDLSTGPADLDVLSTQKIDSGWSAAPDQLSGVLVVGDPHPEAVTMPAVINDSANSAASLLVHDPLYQVEMPSRAGSPGRNTPPAAGSGGFRDSPT
jgi:hypothetical protein